MSNTVYVRNISNFINDGVDKTKQKIYNQYVITNEIQKNEN